MIITRNGHLIAESKRDYECLDGLRRQGWQLSGYKKYSVKIPEELRK